MQREILVVDDDVFLVKMISSYLKKEGFNVQVAHNGDEAIKKLEEEKPDLIILDLIMPISGFEVLEKMQKQKNKTPVIVFSNLSQQDDIDEAMKLGATYFFMKANTTIKGLINIIDKIKS